MRIWFRLLRFFALGLSVALGGFLFSWFTGLKKSGAEDPKNFGELVHYVNYDPKNFVFSMLITAIVAGALIFVVFGRKK